MTLPSQESSDEDLWDAERLGKFLGLSPKTIVAKASQAPDTIPPRVVHLRVLRWVPSVCRSWVLQGNTRPKLGRPPLAGLTKLIGQGSRCSSVVMHPSVKAGSVMSTY